MRNYKSNQTKSTHHNACFMLLGVSYLLVYLAVPGDTVVASLPTSAEERQRRTKERQYIYVDYPDFISLKEMNAMIQSSNIKQNLLHWAHS